MYVYLRFIKDLERGRFTFLTKSRTEPERQDRKAHVIRSKLEKYVRNADLLEGEVKKRISRNWGGNSENRIPNIEAQKSIHLLSKNNSFFKSGRTFRKMCATTNTSIYAYVK